MNQLVEPYVCYGGEDYELLFSVPPAMTEALNDVSGTTSVQLARIGRITKEKQVVDQRSNPLPRPGPLLGELIMRQIRRRAPAQPSGSSNAWRDRPQRARIPTNNFPPTSGHVAGLITHPSGIAQAVAEGVDELLYIEMSDETLVVACSASPTPTKTTPAATSRRCGT